jgi:hypothetical protein
MNEAVDFSEGDSLTVDFNSVEDTGFEALPKGMYPCIISECEFTYSQSSGNPMWTLQLEVAEGEYAGRKLFNHLVFAGKGMGITKQNLGRIKPELLESPFSPDDEEVIAGMLGLEVKAKVTVRKYEGEDRNNVNGLFPGSSDGFV